MGILDWLFSDIPDSPPNEDYRRSSYSSTRIVCKPDDEGQTKCTKYTTTRSSDPNHPYEDQVTEEEVPYDPMHMNPLQDVDDIMKDFFHSPRFGDIFRRREHPWRLPDQNLPTPEFDINPPNMRRWSRGNNSFKSEKRTDVYDI